LRNLNRLRVTHVTEDISAIAGGVPAVVRQLSERFVGLGILVQIAHATGAPSDLPAEVDVFTFPPTGLGHAWALGHGLREGVAQLAAPADGYRSVFHIHGAWSAPQYFAARSAHASGTPFVFTAHGMLDPWLWNEQGWRVRLKKRAYWAAAAYPVLSKASVIHALTPLERQHLSRLFPQNRIEVIPNAIDVEDLEECPRSERSKTLLFLGRIEPKKGVDLLLRAFAKARISSEWSLDIVGPVWTQTYLSELKAIVKEFELEERVRFRGPLFGEEKRKMIDAAWVMVAPSHSEGLSLVNLEAAARGLPSITTPPAGLHDWESGGGLLVEPNDGAVRKAIETSCSWSAQEQRDRGVASRRLVQQRYSWQVVLPMWSQLYSSL